MTPRLTSELSEALWQQGGPLEVHDEQGQLAYVIVSKNEFRHLLDHDFRQWLQVGLDQADRGEEADWDTQALLV